MAGFASSYLPNRANCPKIKSCCGVVCTTSPSSLQSNQKNLRYTHQQLEASINCVGHPHPTLRYCDKVTLIVGFGFIFFYLDLGGGGGGGLAHKGPRLLYYPISSHAAPSHVIYHQEGHSSLFHHKPLGLLTSFSGTHLSTLYVYHIFPFS
jgi:hypothetical protein